MTEEQRKQYINIIDYIGVDENNNQHNEYTYKLPMILFKVIKINMLLLEN